MNAWQAIRIASALMPHTVKLSELAWRAYHETNGDDPLNVRSRSDVTVANRGYRCEREIKGCAAAQILSKEIAAQRQLHLHEQTAEATLSQQGGAHMQHTGRWSWRWLNRLMCFLQHMHALSVLYVYAQVRADTELSGIPSLP